MNRRKFLKLLGIGSATVAGGVAVGKVAEASEAFDVPHIDYLTSPSSYFTDQPSLAIPALNGNDDPIPYAAPSNGHVSHKRIRNPNGWKTGQFAEQILGQTRWWKLAKGDDKVVGYVVSANKEAVWLRTLTQS